MRNVSTGRTVESSEAVTKMPVSTGYQHACDADVLRR